MDNTTKKFLKNKIINLQLRLEDNIDHKTRLEIHRQILDLYMEINGTKQPTRADLDNVGEK